ncbi:MAG: phage minor capsid protein, partial [Lachnospiraceae bacterium]
MADYDIEKAFKAIEDELIASMMRNIDHHRAEETAAGYNWEQWQVKQLEALEMYKKANVSKFTRRFSNINAQVDAMISAAKTAGETEQEQKILRAIKRGFTGTKKVAPGMEVQFFRLNDAKLNALIDATTNDLQRAEHAMLRFANDQYRKIIFNAQVYANTGGTYEKAVDMATKAFLSAGINCIQYSNGSRHNIKDYAKMAVQTANK